MRRIFDPHQPGTGNLARQPLAVAYRLPGIVHAPQAQGWRADLAMPLDQHGRVVGVEAACIADDGDLAFLVAVRRDDAGPELRRQAVLVEDPVGQA